MKGVNDEIGGAAVIAGQGGEPPDPIKLRAPRDKGLRTPIGDMDGTEKMRHTSGFPMVASGLPHVPRQMAPEGGEKIASEPACRHAPVLPVHEIVQPYYAGHLSLDEAQEHSLLAAR